MSGKSSAPEGNSRLVETAGFALLALAGSMLLMIKDYAGQIYSQLWMNPILTNGLE